MTLAKGKMATLKQYVETDFRNYLTVFQTLKYARGDESMEAVFRLLMDFQGCSQFIAFYVPSCSFAVDLCHHIIGEFQRALDLRTGTIISSGVRWGADDDRRRAGIHAPCLPIRGSRTRHPGTGRA